MQSLHPERFDMRNGAKEWPLWIDHFERFRIASGLDKKGEKVQVNTLLFHLGRKAEEIFKSFNLTAANADKYDTVKQKFQNHFVRQRNVIYERAVFNQRVQREGEKAEAFITALFTLAEHCAYDDLREDLIRDRIVVGIRDHELSRKLQLQADLTLERVITQVRQNEDIHGHQPVVRAQASIPPAAAALDAVATSRATPSSRVGTSRPRQSKPPKTTPVAPSDKSISSRAASTKSCGWCGANATHPRANCPAANAECGICRKHGHYARVCRSAPVRRDDPKSRALNEVAESDDAAVFLGALHLDVTENSPDRPWLVPLRVGVVPVVFKIDSGADATAIPESLYRMAFRTPLTQPTTKLRTASGANLSIIGMFRSSLSRIEGRPSLPEENIYVIKDLHTPLLSRNASTSLQLIQRIDTLDSTQQVRLAFPKLFTGLGKFPGQYTIQLKELRDAQAADEECQAIMTFCSKGWPAPRTLKGDQKICHSVAAELTVSDGLLLRGQRLYIPRALRQDTLARLHAGHQGIVKCRARAATSVWWPGLSTQLASLVNECSVCRPLRPVAPEPLLPSDAPNLPWEVLGSDLFEWNGAHYLLVVDYLSRFPEIAQLPETSSSTVISRLKSIFARHGIPKILRSDNGPQFSSTQFSAFAKEYGFAHITSSPNHPQSNGEAERMVKTVKSLLSKSSDPNLALMVYRSSPLANGLSPAEILMGRRIRTTIPLSESSLVPATPPIDQIRQFDQQARARSKEIHDDRHRAKELPSLREGDTVWIKDREEYGRVIKLHDAPRSYVVASRSGEFRRNRRYLVTMNAAPDDVFDEEDEPPSSPEATPNPPVAATSRSGRRIVLPARFQ